MASASREPLARLLRPRVEYQADLRIDSGHLVLSGPVHYTPDRERRTLTFEGSRVPARPMIIRRDRHVVWVLDPEHRSYYQLPLSASNELISGALTESIEVGRESIDGREATRYRVRFAEAEGAGLVGHVWISADDIVLRVEGTTVDAGKNPRRPFRLSLRNLKVGPQPPELFEVPKGFTPVAPSHPTLGIMAPPPGQR